jgi:formiminotetrahydrofolate cyclodeaminase
MLADSSLATLLDRVASSDPAPAAGPSAGWTCALAAALVEMVSAVALRKDPPDLAAAVQRRDRAAELRARALELAHRDVAAYTEVLSVLRRRDEPGHGRRLRGALSEAANPPLAIAEVAAEVTRLAADAGSEAVAPTPERRSRPQYWPRPWFAQGSHSSSSTSPGRAETRAAFVFMSSQKARAPTSIAR